MKRIVAFVCVGVFVCGFATASARAVLTVRITAEIADTTLEAGQITDGSVRAFVEGGGPGEGIFTYDLDVLLSDSAVLEIVPFSVSRVGADPGLLGSDGSIGPTGIEAVAGGFSDENVGIGSPATLFTFQVRALSSGAASVTPGPDADVYFIDVLLYSTQPLQVSYELGPTVTVRESSEPGAIPEPLTASLGGLSLLALGAATRRRGLVSR